jgi:hypothetical protein
VDSSGFATGVLKERIDYKGSSVAFIQLIAAMERDGEITREIRGKRTYKISATPETQKAFMPVGSAPVARAAQATAEVDGTVISIDYDKLANALLRQLWSVISAVATADRGEHEAVSAESTSEDYMDKLTAARRALDELFSDVESKASAGKV